VLGDLRAGGVGGLNVRQVFRRPGEALQVLRSNHRGHAAVPMGEEHGLMARAGVVDDVGEPTARGGDGHISHGPQYR